jgi:hypothetical protein
MMLLHGARLYLAAMALATVAFTTTASAQVPRVKVGKEYAGNWYTNNKVTYRIESKTPGVLDYHGTMRFHSNNRVERCRIRYTGDGKVMVTRWLDDGGYQSFIAYPRRYERPNGSTYYEYSARLFGRGVDKAPNEFGWLWVWKE